ncbi:DUF692 domain-containing protein [Ferrimonas sediminicola]|uniref:DUF692 domain-containing protein n=1 Tax=Ferrimonas sediminicola TaxID=2569538 RepID=A0A4U1BDK5_9GAMM|nr:DUF692 domain-containing protein [Ferrimonas sediminicola]TKB49066.1 DUF692 domain-containing protein [Ferrimonas sediminicola]
MITGAGLGLRREMVDEFILDGVPSSVNFLEVAPENWMKVPPKLAHKFRALTEQYPFVCHGLSLSIGAPAPLDLGFVKQIKLFLDTHGIELYSEHLSYCSGNAHMYDLMPIPFTEEAVSHVAERIRTVQEIIERPLIIENVSYYAEPGATMDEVSFINAVLAESDCRLLLDVNNIYVNSINHGYDADAFLEGIDGGRTAYYHVAGHYRQAEDFAVDTHGAPVIDPVWRLLAKAYERHGIHPTLLERDFNLPQTRELVAEIDRIHQIASQAKGVKESA